MVAMDREVPGNTAEKIWQKPTQAAWRGLICSTLAVQLFDVAAFGAAPPLRSPYTTSTAHMTTPPAINETPITSRLPRFFPITFVRSSAGTAVTTNEMPVSVSGWLQKLP
jgi:hypothetical protein